MEFSLEYYLYDTFYSKSVFLFFFWLISAGYIDTELITTDLFRNTDSFRNKTSDRLYGWVIESFTSHSFRNTLIKGWKQVSESHFEGFGACICQLFGFTTLHIPKKEVYVWFVKTKTKCHWNKVIKPILISSQDFWKLYQVV